jgi:AcrR family transcriptional regulator
MMGVTEQPPTPAALASPVSPLADMSLLPRRRNPRGQGARLREEIIDGAAALLEATGNETSITLRSVARQIGVAAPSVARHFTDRAEIVDAVVAAELTQLRDAMAVANDAHQGDPPAQLTAITRAVYDHGRAHPNRYRVVFERRFLPLWEKEQRIMQATAPLITETFALVVTALENCVATGASTSTDPFADAVALWCAVHGLVALPPTIPSFPWPDLDTLLVTSIGRITQLTVPAPVRLPATKASGGKAR